MISGWRSLLIIISKLLSQSWNLKMPKLKKLLSTPFISALTQVLECFIQLCHISLRNSSRDYLAKVDQSLSASLHSQLESLTLKMNKLKQILHLSSLLSPSSDLNSKLWISLRVQLLQSLSSAQPKLFKRHSLLKLLLSKVWSDLERPLFSANLLKIQLVASSNLLMMISLFSSRLLDSSTWMMKLLESKRESLNLEVLRIISPRRWIWRDTSKKYQPRSDKKTSKRWLAMKLKSRSARRALKTLRNSFEEVFNQI